MPVEKNRETLRIIPLGGQEEVGRNMTVFEYGAILWSWIWGLMFPEEDMPESTILSRTPAIQRQERISAAWSWVTGIWIHWAAPYPQKIEYRDHWSDLTLAMIKREWKISKRIPPTAQDDRINSVRDKIRLGKFEINFFDVEHSIMDAVGVIIKTPAGTVIHPGDWRWQDPESGKAVSIPTSQNCQVSDSDAGKLGRGGVRPAATSEKKCTKTWKNF